MISKRDIGQSSKITIEVEADFESIVPGFLTDWKSEVGYMHKALAENDYATIRRYGHDMKGTGGACGFNSITDLGAGLEQAAEAGDPEEILTNLNALADYLARVDVIYV